MRGRPLTRRFSGCQRHQDIRTIVGRQVRGLSELGGSPDRSYKARQLCNSRQSRGGPISSIPRRTLTTRARPTIRSTIHRFARPVGRCRSCRRRARSVPPVRGPAHTRKGWGSCCTTSQAGLSFGRRAQILASLGVNMQPSTLARCEPRNASAPSGKRNRGMTGLRSSEQLSSPGQCDRGIPSRR